MEAQELYDLREEYAFCSGTDLHEFFEGELGDPSPSGYAEISSANARHLVASALICMRANNGNTLDGLYTSEEKNALTDWIFG
jgi:hypothetical protein